MLKSYSSFNFVLVINCMTIVFVMYVFFKLNTFFRQYRSMKLLINKAGQRYRLSSAFRIKVNSLVASKP